MVCLWGGPDAKRCGRQPQLAAQSDGRHDMSLAVSGPGTPATEIARDWLRYPYRDGRNIKQVTLEMFKIHGLCCVRHLVEFVLSRNPHLNVEH